MPNIKELRRMADWIQAKTSQTTGINRAKLSLAECGDELSVAVLSGTQPESPK